MKTLEFHRSRTETGTEWRWRLLTHSGQVLAASSEGFERLGGAKKSAQSSVAYLLRVDVKTRTTRRGWLEETKSEPVHSPKFYGVARPLDGPRATIEASERDAYNEDVHKLIGETQERWLEAAHASAVLLQDENLNDETDGWAEIEHLSPEPVAKTKECHCRPTMWYHYETCPKWGQTW